MARSAVVAAFMLFTAAVAIPAFEAAIVQSLSSVLTSALRRLSRRLKAAGISVGFGSLGLSLGVVLVDGVALVAFLGCASFSEIPWLSCGAAIGKGDNVSSSTLSRSVSVSTCVFIRLLVAVSLGTGVSGRGLFHTRAVKLTAAFFWSWSW